MSQKRPCALITGASLGLGRAFARECAARGMDLLLVALPGSGLPALAASIARERSVSVDSLEADLTKPATLNRLRQKIRAKGLRVELLINNAGIGPHGVFMDAPLERHEKTIGVNAVALVRMTRLLLAEWDGQGRPSILNVASLGAFFPMPTLPVYSATKSFVLHFSLALREELMDRVGMSVLCPNAIRTCSEVDDYVDRLNFVARLACMTPERIARIALDGLARGKVVIIPGFLNQALAALGRFLPRTFVMRTIRHYWGDFGKAPEEARPAVLKASAV